MTFLTQTMNHITIVAPVPGGKLPPMWYAGETYEEPPKKDYAGYISSTFRIVPSPLDATCIEQIDESREQIERLGNPKYSRALSLCEVMATLIDDMLDLQQRYNLLGAKLDRLLSMQRPDAIA